MQQGQTLTLADAVFPRLGADNRAVLQYLPKGAA